MLTQESRLYKYEVVHILLHVWEWLYISIYINMRLYMVIFTYGGGCTRLSTCIEYNPLYYYYTYIIINSYIIYTRESVSL